MTGEPYAGNPPVRFGGRGDRVTGFPYLYQITNSAYLLDSRFRGNDEFGGELLK